jgi:hypothetical protein
MAAKLSAKYCGLKWFDINKNKMVRTLENN